MSPIQKVLWSVTTTADHLLAQAQAIGASAVAIRTDNGWLPGAIPNFHAQNIKVYGWRWPAVTPVASMPGYYADEQADFVVQTLIPAGLDGYIVDAESDGPSYPNRDWNQVALGPLAQGFVDKIANAGAADGQAFHFGVTSGCRYPTSFPNIPWAAFLSRAQAAYPQVYWRADGITENGGTPQAAFNHAQTNWMPIVPAGVPIVPIIGQLDEITAADIQAFGAIMAENDLTSVHFYADAVTVPAANYEAAAAL